MHTFDKHSILGHRTSDKLTLNFDSIFSIFMIYFPFFWFFSIIIVFCQNFWYFYADYRLPLNATPLKFHLFVGTKEYENIFRITTILLDIFLKQNEILIRISGT